MHPKWIIGAVGAVALATANLPTQVVDQRLSLEMEAVRGLLAMQHLDNLSRTSLGISPIFATDGASPGTEYGGVRRPAPRNAALARNLGARVVRLDSALACELDRCRYMGAETILITSNPSIAGDTAFVTVTAHYNSTLRKQTEFITVRFILSRAKGRWQIRQSTVLGQT